MAHIIHPTYISSISSFVVKPIEIELISMAQMGS